VIALFTVRPILEAVTVLRVGDPGHQARLSLLGALFVAAFVYGAYVVVTKNRPGKIPPGSNGAINGTATKVDTATSASEQATSMRELVKAHDAAKDDQR
jgi:hypothetical protein